MLRARFYSLLMLRQLHKGAKNKRYLGNHNACLVAKKKFKLKHPFPNF